MIRVTMGKRYGLIDVVLSRFGAAHSYEEGFQSRAWSPFETFCQRFAVLSVWLERKDTGCGKGNDKIAELVRIIAVPEARNWIVRPFFVTTEQHCFGITN